MKCVRNESETHYTNAVRCVCRHSRGYRGRSRIGRRLVLLLRIGSRCQYNYLFLLQNEMRRWQHHRLLRLLLRRWCLKQLLLLLLLLQLLLLNLMRHIRQRAATVHAQTGARCQHSARGGHCRHGTRSTADRGRRGLRKRSTKQCCREKDVMILQPGA